MTHLHHQDYPLCATAVSARGIPSAEPQVRNFFVLLRSRPVLKLPRAEASRPSDRKSQGCGLVVAWLCWFDWLLFMNHPWVGFTAEQYAMRNNVFRMA